MNPSSLIRKKLGDDVWRKCVLRSSSTGDLAPTDELSPFQVPRIYIVRGSTRQFDFPTLPHGSYCIFSADGRKAVRLTREGKEVESLLEQNWTSLPLCNPVVLASLILTFFDDGIHSTHQVLPNAKALHSPKRHVLDEEEMKNAQDFIGNTTVAQLDDSVVIRAVTLCGWMHDKGNLGIETIRVVRSGKVQLDKREVLSKQIFASVPSIRY